MFRKTGLALAAVLCLFIGACSDSTGKTEQRQVGTTSQETIEQTVYLTRTGAKYHRAGCRYLAKSSIPTTLSQAKARYSPCSKCNPPS